MKPDCTFDTDDVLHRLDSLVNNHKPFHDSNAVVHTKDESENINHNCKSILKYHHVELKNESPSKTIKRIRFPECSTEMHEIIGFSTYYWHDEDSESESSDGDEDDFSPVKSRIAKFSNRQSKGKISNEKNDVILTQPTPEEIELNKLTKQNTTFNSKLDNLIPFSGEAAIKTSNDLTTTPPVIQLKPFESRVSPGKINKVSPMINGELVSMKIRTDDMGIPVNSSNQKAIDDDIDNSETKVTPCDMKANHKTVDVEEKAIKLDPNEDNCEHDVGEDENDISDNHLSSEKMKATRKLVRRSTNTSSSILKGTPRPVVLIKNPSAVKPTIAKKPNINVQEGKVSLLITQKVHSLSKNEDDMVVTNNEEPDEVLIISSESSQIDIRAEQQHEIFDESHKDEEKIELDKEEDNIVMDKNKSLLDEIRQALRDTKLECVSDIALDDTDECKAPAEGCRKSTKRHAPNPPTFLSEFNHREQKDDFQIDFSDENVKENTDQMNDEAVSIFLDNDEDTVSDTSSTVTPYSDPSTCGSGSDSNASDESSNLSVNVMNKSALRNPKANIVKSTNRVQFSPDTKLSSSSQKYKSQSPYLTSCPTSYLNWINAYNRHSEAMFGPSSHVVQPISAFNTSMVFDSPPTVQPLKMQTTLSHQTPHSTVMTKRASFPFANHHMFNPVMASCPKPPPVLKYHSRPVLSSSNKSVGGFVDKSRCKMKTIVERTPVTRDNVRPMRAVISPEKISVDYKIRKSQSIDHLNSTKKFGLQRSIVSLDDSGPIMAYEPIKTTSKVEELENMSSTNASDIPSTKKFSDAAFDESETASVKSRSSITKEFMSSTNRQKFTKLLKQIAPNMSGNSSITSNSTISNFFTGNTNSRPKLPSNFFDHEHEKEILNRKEKVRPSIIHPIDFSNGQVEIIKINNNSVDTYSKKRSNSLTRRGSETSSPVNKQTSFKRQDSPLEQYAYLSSSSSSSSESKVVDSGHETSSIQTDNSSSSSEENSSVTSDENSHASSQYDDSVIDISESQTTLILKTKTTDELTSCTVSRSSAHSNLSTSLSLPIQETDDDKLVDEGDNIRIVTKSLPPLRKTISASNQIRDSVRSSNAKPLPPPRTHSLITGISQRQLLKEKMRNSGGGGRLLTTPNDVAVDNTNKENDVNEKLEQVDSKVVVSNDKDNNKIGSPPSELKSPIDAKSLCEAASKLRKVHQTNSSSALSISTTKSCMNSTCVTTQSPSNATQKQLTLIDELKLKIEEAQGNKNNIKSNRGQVVLEKPPKATTHEIGVVECDSEARKEVFKTIQATATTKSDDQIIATSHLSTVKSKSPSVIVESRTESVNDLSSFSSETSPLPDPISQANLRVLRQIYKNVMCQRKQQEPEEQKVDLPVNSTPLQLCLGEHNDHTTIEISKISVDSNASDVLIAYNFSSQIQIEDGNFLMVINKNVSGVSVQPLPQTAYSAHSPNDEYVSGLQVVNVQNSTSDDFDIMFGVDTEGDEFSGITTGHIDEIGSITDVKTICCSSNKSPTKMVSIISNCLELIRDVDGTHKGLPFIVETDTGKMFIVLLKVKMNDSSKNILDITPFDHEESYIPSWTSKFLDKLVNNSDSDWKCISDCLNFLRYVVFTDLDTEWPSTSVDMISKMNTVCGESYAKIISLERANFLQTILDKSIFGKSTLTIDSNSKDNSASLTHYELDKLKYLCEIDTMDGVVRDACDVILHILYSFNLVYRHLSAATSSTCPHSSSSQSPVEINGRHDGGIVVHTNFDIQL